MEKKLYALTYCYEGTDNSYPYACTIAVSNDIETLRLEMKKCVEEDTQINEEDEWDDSCNYQVNSSYNDAVELQHKKNINLYTKYKIHSVKLL